MIANAYEWYEPFEPLPASAGERQVACLITTQEGQYLLRWEPRPLPEEGQGGEPLVGGRLEPFGGPLEPSQNARHHLCAQMAHWLGAQVQPDDLTALGTVVSSADQAASLFFVWHDHLGTIQQCDAAAPMLFNRPEDLLAHPQLDPRAQWALRQSIPEAWQH